MNCTPYIFPWDRNKNKLTKKSLKTYFLYQKSTESNCHVEAALSKCCLCTSLHSGYPDHWWHCQRPPLQYYRLFLGHHWFHNEIQRNLRTNPNVSGMLLQDYPLRFQLQHHRRSKHFFSPLLSFHLQLFQLDIWNSHPSCKIKNIYLFI